MIRFFLFLLLSLKLSFAFGLEFSVAAESAVVMNANTGAVVYEKNGYKQVFPASTTKIATALYALHCLKDDLNRKVVAKREALGSITSSAKIQSNYRSPPHWLEVGGSHIGIKFGEEWAIYDLLCAMLVSSANDAANVIAQSISGSIPLFVKDLNGYLKGIGCEQTNFCNPHGLHHPNHFTTPYDLALMAKVGLQNPTFRKIVSLSRYECQATNLENQRNCLQTNFLLRRDSRFFYSNAIGVKTGTTNISGKNLVAAAEQDDGRSFIVVLMGYRGVVDEMFNDAIAVFETLFSEIKERKYLLKRGITNVTKKIVGSRDVLTTLLKEDVFIDFYPSDPVNAKVKVVWEVSKLPIASGDRVGRVEVFDEKGVISQTVLFANNDLKPNVFYFISKLIKSKWVILTMTLSFVIFLLIRRNKKIRI